MVLGILIATITAPGLLGSQEAIRQSQSKEKREEHRARRCNLIARCTKSSTKSREIDGRPVVLRNGRLWIDTGTADGSTLGHAYAGYYLPYPDSKYEGLVTTITDVAPIMNWVYVEKETHIVRYGVRADAQPNLTGPFDCTRQDRRLTFDGWEGWCAVEEVPGLWALYFDFDDDGLRSKVPPSTRVLEVELLRKEKRFRKDGEERMRDQTTKRAVDVKDDEPIDQPLGEEALVQRPGVVDDVSGNDGSAEEKGAAKPKPFTIPKSIFDHPPPMLEGTIFQRPNTPPPAYSTTPRPETPKVTKAGEIGLDSTQPAAVTSTSPLLTAKPEPMPGKSVTPVRKRSSGTKALAQAQMFEAMAAAKTQKSPPQRRQSQRSSRASSNADSVSVYSVDGLDLPPIKTATAVSKAPAIRPAPTTQPRKQNETQKQSQDLKKATTKQAESKPRQSPSMPIRQRAPLSSPDLKDPAVFSNDTEPLKPTKPPPSRRPTISRNPPPPQPSRSRSTAKPPTRSPFPLQRQMTAPPPSSTRPPSTRSRSTSVSSTGTARKSLAATMTTGKGNQGMRNRVGSEPGRGRGSVGGTVPVRSGTSRERFKEDGRKTTSTLIREIDELVGLEGE